MSSRQECHTSPLLFTAARLYRPESRVSQLNSSTRVTLGTCHVSHCRPPEQEQLVSAPRLRHGHPAARHQARVAVEPAHV